MNKVKTSKQMERHIKGIANHHRIEILLYISKQGAKTLEEIVTALKVNEKTIGEHARRLYLAGLIDKKYRGRFVEHRLSPYGRTFVKFLENFKNTTSQHT